MADCLFCDILVTRAEIAKVGLEAIFNDALQARLEEQTDKTKAESKDVFEQYRQFLDTGLSLEAFARKVRKENPSTLRRRFIEWGLPIIELTSEVIDQIKTEARKRNALVMCDCPNCLPCEILRRRKAF